MMFYKIACDRDGTVLEGKIESGTAFTLPPGWVNMNFYEGAAPGALPPAPILRVLCPDCAKQLMSTEPVLKRPERIQNH